MKVHQWQGPGHRIASSEDVFFSSPLSESTIFRFSTDYFEIEPHSGEFSLKFVLSGEEHYVFGRRTVSLRPGRFLLVNAGDVYSSRIDSRTESLSVFFRESEFGDAVSSLVSCHEALLDVGPDGTTAAVVARVGNRCAQPIRHTLDKTISAIEREDHAATVESTRLLLLDALLGHWSIVPPTALPNIRRRSTRDELVTRILRAREMIDATDGNAVDLDTLAEAACLSQFHFLRVFTELVGDTPLAYARRRRLELGARLLKQGEDPVAAARRAGYKTVRNFSRAYRRTFGCSAGYTM